MAVMRLDVDDNDDNDNDDDDDDDDGDDDDATKLIQEEDPASLDETEQDAVGKRCMAKVSRRVLPLVFAAALMNNVTANNIALVSSGIMSDLDMDARAFGIAVSVYFVTNLLLQIPLTLVSKKAGARRALPVMSLLFGVVSAATSAVPNMGALVAIRLLLGAVQAPFVPFVSGYIASFYGSTGFGRAFAVSVNLGAYLGRERVRNRSQSVEILFPLPVSDTRLCSALNMDFKNTGNTLAQIVPHGAIVIRAVSGSRAPWRLFFIIESIPNFLLVLPLMLLLPDGPSSSGAFLTAAELRWLADKERDTEASRESRSGKRLASNDGRKPVLLRLLLDARVLLLFSTLSFLAAAYSGVFFFLPTILSNDGRYSMSVSALLNSVPFLIATPLALVNASIADRTGRRLHHVMFGQAMATAGMLLTALILRMEAPPTALELASLTLIEIGIECFYTPFVAFQGTMLSESVAATGYAVINMGGSTVR